MNLPIPATSPGTPNINLALSMGDTELASRLANQNRLIADGIENGTLNKSELSALRLQRDTFGQTLRKDVLEYGPEGTTLNQSQHDNLFNQMDAAGTTIYQFKHNF